jgi:hypothetical protein
MTGNIGVDRDLQQSLSGICRESMASALRLLPSELVGFLMVSMGR